MGLGNYRMTSAELVFSNRGGEVLNVSSNFCASIFSIVSQK